MTLRTQKPKNSEAGIGLVEVIAALGISVIVITALVSMSLFTLRSSTQSKLLLEATKEANTTMEMVRGLRDGPTDWVDFVDIIRLCTNLPTCDVNSCDYTASIVCTIDSSGTVQMYSGANAAIMPTATTPRVYFVARNTSGGVLTTADTTARITVEAHWLVGSQHRFTHLYTDLTNWRGR